MKNRYKIMWYTMMKIVIDTASVEAPTEKTLGGIYPADAMKVLKLMCKVESRVQEDLIKEGAQ